jgi:pyridoxamine 5'-phosphate oxidase-like protein
VASWSDFANQAPELAAAIEARFEAHIHSVLATLRRDGSPRLSGLETRFSDGELWLAMMPDARKAADLRRDPRFALHSSPDTEMVDGDAKVNGRAVEITDAATIARFVGALPQEPPPSGVGLFRTELSDASLTRVQGDELVVDFWHDGGPPRQTRRQ